jgi:hypothetical protein
LVGEAEKGFHNGASQHLIGTHAVGTLPVGDVFTPVQILKNTIADGRVGVNDGADDFQLFALGMVGYLGHQRHLFLPFFAHFVIGSFLAFVVILVVWRLSIYYNEKKKTTAKCAFFMYYG